MPSQVVLCILLTLLRRKQYNPQSIKALGSQHTGLRTINKGISQPAHRTSRPIAILRSNLSYWILRGHNFYLNSKNSTFFTFLLFKSRVWSKIWGKQKKLWQSFNIKYQKGGFYSPYSFLCFLSKPLWKSSVNLKGYPEVLTTPLFRRCAWLLGIFERPGGKV